MLRCSDINCREHVAITGRTWNQPITNPDGSERYSPVFEPHHFFPEIPLFPLLNSFPSELRQQLVLSFGHFWHDQAAAGNALRGAVEVMMDERKVRKCRPKTRKPLPLHDRLVLFEKQEPEHAKMLMAIKWIGNIGSHREKLTKKKLIVAYKLAEHVFSEVYGEKTKTLTKLAKKINRKKGK